MESSDRESDRIRQILRDAGCGDDKIEAFVSCRSSCSREEQMRMLCLYRKKLLDRTHEAQRRLECMDYLIYQMQNSDELK